MYTNCQNPVCYNFTKKPNKFCSISCSSSINSPKVWATKVKKYPIFIDCKNCGKSMELYSKTRMQQFCSHTCSAIYNNRQGRNNKNWPNCLNCQNIFFKQHNKKMNYCSIKCRQVHEIELWISGELDATRTYRQADFVRRHLEERSNNTCEICGQEPWWNGKPLGMQVDHIDGDWQNNTYENMRLICPHCHTQTENWGSKNKGNGRTWKKNYNQYKAKI